MERYTHSPYTSSPYTAPSSPRPTLETQPYDHSIYASQEQIWLEATEDEETAVRTSYKINEVY